MGTIATTLALVAVMNNPVGVTHPQFLEEGTNFLPTFTAIVPSMPSETSLMAVPKVSTIALTKDSKTPLFDKLLSFDPESLDGDPGIISKVEHIITAVEFVTAIPAYIPNPILMRNDEGQIGMYWDNDDAYVDISIDEDGSISLFSKVRSTEAESFISGVDIDQIDDAWMVANLGSLLTQYVQAA